MINSPFLYNGVVVALSRQRRRVAITPREGIPGKVRSSTGGIVVLWQWQTTLQIVKVSSLIADPFYPLQGSVNMLQDPACCTEKPGKTLLLLSIVRCLST